MDPLSITASTIAIITVISTSFKGAAGLYSAPGDIESVLNDLADTQVILKSIEDGLLQYTASPRCDEQRLQELSKRLLQVRAMVQELSKSIKLDTLRAKPGTPSARWAWLRAKSKVLKVKHKVDTISAEIVRLQGSFER
jgi:DNA repair ATPase RecN